MLIWAIGNELNLRATNPKVWDAVNDISKMKNNSQKKLIDTLTPILAEYAQKNSISYIIPKQSIIIGKSELDLTKTIIEILNSKIKKIKLQ